MRLFFATRSGPSLALLSAALFGASTPAAKRLLGVGVDPWLLAALLYLGSGLGLLLVRLAQRAAGQRASEAPLQRRDLPWLAGVVLMGGVLAPVLLMYGLTRVSAAAGALLLNLEAVATLALAWLVVGEHADRRLLLGAAAIVLGAGLLSWRGGSMQGGLGALAIAAACCAWAIDNNLTRKLSAADPVHIAAVKGWIAGSVNLAIALARGTPLPGVPAIAGALLVGLLGYGVSLVLFVLALRHLGTARTGAYFSTAPFVGAVIAVIALGEPVTAQLLAAGALMGIGVYLHLTEQHAHEHVHEALAHEHRHYHDDMHDHAHGPGDPEGEPHSHRHGHAPLVHSHPHYPDLHHRHTHS